MPVWDKGLSPDRPTMIQPYLIDPSMTQPDIVRPYPLANTTAEIVAKDDDANTVLAQDMNKSKLAYYDVKDLIDDAGDQVSMLHEVTQAAGPDTTIEMRGTILIVRALGDRHSAIASRLTKRRIEQTSNVESLQIVVHSLSDLVRAGVAPADIARDAQRITGSSGSVDLVGTNLVVTGTSDQQLAVAAMTKARRDALSK